MARKPTQSKTRKPEGDPAAVDAFTVDGNKVEIARIGNRETLLINGRVEKYYRSEAGYLLWRDAYQKPVTTLRDAVERYFKHDAAR